VISGEEKVEAARLTSETEDVGIRATLQSQINLRQIAVTLSMKSDSSSLCMAAAQFFGNNFPSPGLKEQPGTDFTCIFKQSVHQRALHTCMQHHN